MTVVAVTCVAGSTKASTPRRVAANSVKCFRARLASSLEGAAEPGAADRYGTDHPLYEQIAELSALRAAHPALADGAQLHRYSSDQDGVYAFSRIAAGKNVEYLVVANSADTAKTATFATYAPRQKFTAIWPASSARGRGPADLRADAAADVTGQAIGIGGDRLSLYSHPAEVAFELREGGWSADAIAAAWPAFDPQPYGVRLPELDLS